PLRRDELDEPSADESAAFAAKHAGACVVELDDDAGAIERCIANRCEVEDLGIAFEGAFREPASAEELLVLQLEIDLMNVEVAGLLAHGRLARRPRRGGLGRPLRARPSGRLALAPCGRG